jgi:2-polyprenyl-3-methyl-5-hydroxy-6-metoxy-1,4-benzoquinol methylase
MSDNKAREYHYYHGELGSQHAYLLPAVEKIIGQLKPKSVFELGCGNGSVAAWLHNKKIEVSAIDASESGIQQAKTAFPDITFNVRSAYDNLAKEFGQFSMVLSLEVVEHLYSPRIFAANVYQLLQPGAYAVISTPYHGYWKNLAIALSGKSDHHFSALWDGGHIKFWSVNTLSELLSEAGFVDIEFRRVGRIPMLAKSMIAIARKPDNAHA